MAFGILSGQSDEVSRREDLKAKPFALNRLTLRFVDPDTEAQFAQEDLLKGLPVIRLFLLFGIFIYTLFGILDYLVARNVVVEIWIIRYAIGTPIIVGALVFSYSPVFLRWAQPVLAVSMLLTGLTIVAMISIASLPTNLSYYAGLIIVVVYCANLLRLRYLYATYVSLALLTAYQVSAIFINPIPLWALLNNDFFLVTATTTGIFSSYAQELHIRHGYISRHLLMEEKARSEELLKESQTANHTKNEFLAVVSHELRTPLNVIIGFSELMKSKIHGPLGSERYGSYIDDIYESGKHLLALISDILDLSKAEAGRLALYEEEVELRELIDRVMRMFTGKAAECGVRMSRIEFQENLWLWVDMRLLTQVMINLISNAIKFTERGGSVTVSIHRDADGGCSLQVADTGIGIDSDDLSRIFEPFVQVESAMSRTREGTGLGLPLSKKIMDLHGGELVMESRIGVGTRIVARLPPDRVILRDSPKETIETLAHMH